MVNKTLPRSSGASGGGDVGLNLIGGFEPSTAGRIKPFAEFRLYVGDGSGVSVAGGLRIPLGN